MSLSRAMIRILAQDDHFDPVEWSLVECIENQVARGVNGFSFFLFSQELL